MEKGAGGGDEPASAAGGICDRLLTFLAKSLSMNRQKNITGGPRAGGGHRQMEGGEGEEEDEFAIRIERADFDFEFFNGHGDEGHNGVTTILEDVSKAKATASDEQRQKGAAAAADHPLSPAAVEEITKVRKAVTIKEDRPEEAGAGDKGAPALEKKKSMFKKRQASSSSGAGGEEQGGRAPRRSGLRPRMPAVPRVPSNINEQSSTFIEERRKGFGATGKPVPDK
ncbi:uncharacterized protein LOC133900027 [Phragmites australis]|uniref:uncharacterized protein LOC133900027 n=1 Tax=Phragmites australis TaxID=29695 RepID=UPI002D7922BD|nr:uncharacterized protein LOC133900027 [Phragmites australis]